MLHAASPEITAELLAASLRATTALAADNHRYPTIQETLPPNRPLRRCFHAAAEVASPAGDGAREAAPGPAPGCHWGPKPPVLALQTSAEQLLNSNCDFLGGVLIGTNNQNRIVTGNRAHQFLPLLLVQGSSHQLGNAHNGFHYQQVLGRAHIQHKLANQPPHRR